MMLCPARDCIGIFWLGEKAHSHQHRSYYMYCICLALQAGVKERLFIGQFCFSNKIKRMLSPSGTLNCRSLRESSSHAAVHIGYHFFVGSFQLSLVELLAHDGR